LKVPFAVLYQHPAHQDKYDCVKDDDGEEWGQKNSIADTVITYETAVKNLAIKITE
jgi:hypothetical protein